MTRYIFRVRVSDESLSSEHGVFLVGSCLELGNWIPSRAIALSSNMPWLRKNDEVKDGPTYAKATWSTWSSSTIDFKSPTQVEYRYFIGGVYDVTNGYVSVHSWEANPRARTLDLGHCPSPHNCAQGPSAYAMRLPGQVEEEEGEEECTDRQHSDRGGQDVAVYGCYDDECCIDRGWLVENRYEIHVRLRSGDGVRLYGDKSAKGQQQQYYIDCFPINIPSEEPPVNTVDNLRTADPQYGVHDPSTTILCSNTPLLPLPGSFKSRDISKIRANVGCQRFGLAYFDENLNSRQVGSVDNLESKVDMDRLMECRDRPLGGVRGVPLEEGNHATFCVVTRHSPRDLVLKLGLRMWPGDYTDDKAYQEELLWNSAPSNENGQCIGAAFVRVPMNNESPELQVYITSNTPSQEVLGTLTCTVTCIGPAPRTVLDSLRLYRGRYVPKATPTSSRSTTPRPLLIGHRGMGSSFSRGQINARARENTLASFTEAAFHGVDMVEFDVALSKDGVPIVYHDFITTVKTTKTDLDGTQSTYSLRVPVQDLTLDELTTLDLCSIPEDSYYATHEGAKAGRRPVRLTGTRGADRTGSDRVFPTLRECFGSVDVTCGFNVEIKYPIRISTGRYEDDLVASTGRDTYVNAILDVVFECMSSKDSAGSGERQIVFSSFDPDVCMMLRAKQHRFPVLFLTQAENDVYPPYMDPRTLSVAAAIEFARSESLAGIDVFSRVLLDNLGLVKKARDAGLLVFCWGEDNNNKGNIGKLRDALVDGIILDRCDEFNDCF